MFFFVLLSILFSLIICISPQTSPGSFIWALPVTYLFSFLILRKCTSRNNKNQITVIITLILLWMRMVFLPIYGVTSGIYGNGNSSEENMSIFLCSYECIVIALVLTFISKKYSLGINETSNTNYHIGLKGSPFIYFMFVLMALAVFFLMGRNLNLFEFGFKAIGEGIEREGDIIDSREITIRQIVSSGYLYLFFIFINIFKNNYEKTNSRRYLYYSIIFAAMMVCVIVGERRTSQIYIAFSCIWLLVHLYPSHKRSIVSYIGISALFVIITMTIYKQFHAFLYDSYEEAVQRGSLEGGFSAGLIDAYFNGINTVKLNLEFASSRSVDVYNFFYDIFRSIFGLHYFFKGGLSTSELYNLQLYGGEQSTGFLLSSIGYGAIYFGVFLAPLISIVNILIVCWLERKMRSSSTIEFTYIWAFVYMRFAYGALGSIPPLISSASRMLIINGFIIYIASLGSHRNSLTTSK